MKLDFNIGNATFSTDIIAQSCPMTRCFACFIDLLGSSHSILNGSDKSFLDGLYAIIKLCNDINKNKPCGLSIRTFSDNIFIMLPVPVDIAEAKIGFRNFLDIISTLQFLLLYHTGELLRGGLTVDDIFADDSFVWGKALVKAHYLESEKSVYPRIVIDMDTCSQFYSNDVNHLIVNDGQSSFVGFLTAMSKEDAAQSFSGIHGKLIDKIKCFNPASLPDANKIFDKYLWTCRYYNEVAKRLGLNDLIINATFLCNGKQYKIF